MTSQDDPAVSTFRRRHGPYLDRTDDVTARKCVRPLLCRRIFITYADTDAAGIIYFAAWFPWMERLHTEWLAGRGVRFTNLADRCGASFVTRATSCEYLAVVRPYDEVEMTMSVGHVGSRSYRIDFMMTRVGDAEQVARASMTLVSVDADGVAAPLPALVANLLTPAPVDDCVSEESA
jgi:acyl-CoA thioester hydrolase